MLRRAANPAGRTLAIGDAVRDIDAARQPGATRHALLVMKPDVVFESVSDITARLAADAAPPPTPPRHRADDH